MIRRILSHFTSPRYVLLLIASMYLVIVGFETQHDDGIVGTTRKNGSGCICHNLTPTNGVKVWVHGPATVNAGSIHTYTVYMVGGPAAAGGFNIATQLGSLGSSTADVQVMGGELTHVSPKSFVADTVRWTFTYTAPAAPTQDTIYAAGNSVNHNLIPDDGDQWNFGPNFVVNVIPAGQPIPILSLLGFCCLAVLLLSATISYLLSERQPKRR